MTTIEITRVEDVRDGDVVTMRDGFGGTYTGPAREKWSIVGFGVEGWSVRHADWTFVRATREVPDLPTEPPAVIRNATIRGTEGVTAFLMSVGHTWVTDRKVGRGYSWAYPEHITAWTPARIIPEGVYETLGDIAAAFREMQASGMTVDSVLYALNRVYPEYITTWEPPRTVAVPTQEAGGVDH